MPQANVLDAGNPKPRAIALHRHIAVFEHRQPVRFQRIDNDSPSHIHVMVAEHAPALRAFDRGQGFRAAIAALRAHGHGQRTFAHIVTGHQHHIRLQPVYLPHYLANEIRLRILLVVNVGELRDPQTVECRRKPLQFDRAVRNLKMMAFESAGISQHSRSPETRQPQETTPRDADFGIVHLIRVKHFQGAESLPRCDPRPHEYLEKSATIFPS